MHHQSPSRPRDLCFLLPLVLDALYHQSNPQSILAGPDRIFTNTTTSVPISFFKSSIPTRKNRKTPTVIAKMKSATRKRTLQARELSDSDVSKDDESTLHGSSPKKMRRTLRSSENDTHSKGPHVCATPGTSSDLSPPAELSVKRELTDDDQTSATDSMSEVSQTRTPLPARVQYFKDHPLCGRIRSNSAYCLRCKKWLSLGSFAYAMSPWISHRQFCDRNWAERTQIVCKDESEDDAPSVVAPSVAAREPPRRKTEAERRAILESDPLAEHVLPNVILCQRCQKWVKFARQRYCVRNWNLHQQRCSRAVPRVSTAERRLRIMNDPQVKSFTRGSVQCASCLVDVFLDGEYALAKWDEHKAGCPKGAHKEPIISLPPRSAPISPRSRAPYSTSSDDTLVSPPSPSLQKGVKRLRESDDDEPEEQPTKNRARTETYTPPDNPSSSVWGWLLLPLQTFVTGVREGLKGPV